MAPCPAPDPGQTRTAVTARYSGLARAARAGQQITDCDPGPFAAGCFGAAGYDDTGELPEGALRASLGCGNPVAVAELRPGETVLDLGAGGGIDVLLSSRRIAPGGHGRARRALPHERHNVGFVREGGGQSLRRLQALAIAFQRARWVRRQIAQRSHAGPQFRRVL